MEWKLSYKRDIRAEYWVWCECIENELPNQKRESVERMYDRAKRHPEQIIEEWYFVGKIALVIFVAAMILFWWKGDAIISREHGCVFRDTVGFYCAGCGGTRAFYYLVHGRLWKSFLYNPFVIYMVVVYVLFMVNTFLYMHTEKIGIRKFPIVGLIYIGIGILIGQCIIRNILFLGFGLTIF
ncbi:MAG: DUF2752 domain-containing protein [Lachnospiraceae bacterium]|nr:DUF2752 domain-containing protein [Lachnospiraceae bacterium]